MNSKIKKFQFTENAQTVFNDLSGVLLGNIQKVQKSSTYIPQAKMINKDVNSVIQLAKLQLDILKFQTHQQKILTKLLKSV